MKNKEKIIQMIQALNEKAKKDLFSIEEKCGKEYFVLDMPNIGRLIELPLDVFDKKDNDNDPTSIV